ncbi:hypothetical protein GOV12_04375 [Candidatus Pacearchaeota archaeon]|nr:hypothetical protein [Candidatus Pacearchaeota archaeon]
MIKGIIITGIVLILVILGISLFAANVYIIKIKKDTTDSGQIDIGFKEDFEDNSEELDEVEINTDTTCNIGVSEGIGCERLKEPIQEKNKCYKTISTSCGEEIVETSCFEELEQVKGCGNLDVPVQEKKLCYVTIKTPCGEKRMETSCFEDIEDEKTYNCYQLPNQEKRICESIIEKNCGFNR